MSILKKNKKKKDNRTVKKKEPLNKTAGHESIKQKNYLKKPGRLAAGFLTGSMLLFLMNIPASREYQEKPEFASQYPDRLVYSGVEKLTIDQPFDRELPPIGAKDAELAKTKDMLYSISDIQKGEYIMVVNKQKQKAQLYKLDYTLIEETKVSTGTNPGNKQRSGDHKTPEGIFEVVSVTNSSQWVHDGELAYGPYFARLDTGSWDYQGNYKPDARSPIGVHGTNQPGRLGTRASMGCIRLENHIIRSYIENNQLKPGSKVLIIPGLNLEQYQVSANPDTNESNNENISYDINPSSVGLEAIISPEKELKSKSEKKIGKVIKEKEQEEEKQKDYNRGVF